MLEGVVVVGKHLLTQARWDSIIAILLSRENVWHELFEDGHKDWLSKLEQDSFGFTELHATSEHDCF